MQTTKSVPVTNRAREVSNEFTQCGQRKFKESGIPEIVTIKVSYDLQITRETFDRLYDAAISKNGYSSIRESGNERHEQMHREAIVLAYLREYGFYGS